MKKTYITPATMVSYAMCEALMAASRLTPNTDEQDITLKDDPYDGEFGAKEFIFDDNAFDE